MVQIKDSAECGKMWNLQSREVTGDNPENWSCTWTGWTNPWPRIRVMTPRAAMRTWEWGLKNDSSTCFKYTWITVLAILEKINGMSRFLVMFPDHYKQYPNPGWYRPRSNFSQLEKHMKSFISNTVFLNTLNNAWFYCRYVPNLGGDTWGPSELKRVGGKINTGLAFHR